MISMFSAPTLWGLGLALLVGFLVIMGLWRGVLSRYTLRDRLMRRARHHSHTPRPVRLQTYTSLFASAERTREKLYSVSSAQARTQEISQPSSSRAPLRAYRDLRQISHLAAEEFYRSQVFVSFVESAFGAHSDAHFWKHVLTQFAMHEQADRGFFFLLVRPSEAHPYLKLQHHFPAEEEGQRAWTRDESLRLAAPPLLGEMGVHLHRFEPFTIHERRASEGLFSLFIPVCKALTSDDRLLLPQGISPRQQVLTSLRLHGCLKFEHRLSEDRRDALEVQITKQRTFYVQAMLFLARCAEVMHTFSGERTAFFMDGSGTMSEGYMETWIRFLLGEISRASEFQGKNGATRGAFCLDLGVVDFSVPKERETALIKYLHTLNAFIQTLGRDDGNGGNAHSPLLWLAASQSRRWRFYVLALTPEGKRFLRNKFSSQLEGFLAQKFPEKTSVSFVLRFHDPLAVDTAFQSLKDI